MLYILGEHKEDSEAVKAIVRLLDPSKSPTIQTKGYGGCPQLMRFLAESYGFGWGELAGEGVEEFAQRGADQVDHGHKRVHVAVASGSRPCRLK